jgi:SNF2 family DNA or RNA helicase
MSAWDGVIRSAAQPVPPAPLAPEPVVDLEAEERELMLKLDKIRRLRHEEQERQNKIALEAAKAAKLGKPIVIKAIALSGAMVVTDSEYRDDLVEYFRTVPGRSYRGHRENMIPLSEWKAFVTGAESLKNVTVTVSAACKDEMDWQLNAPTWLIKLDTNKRWLIAVYGPRANMNPMYAIPGAEIKTTEKHWKIPLTEGWRLFEKMQGIEGVVYEDEVQALLIAQVEQRGKLDVIAKMERGEIYKDFDFGQGFTLRPFQEVGGEFIEATGGRAILADEMGLGKTWQALAYAIKNNLRTMVICPASLKPNWAREIRKLTGGERPTVLQGAEPTQYDLIKFLTEPPKFSIINYDIVGRVLKVKKSTVDEQGFTHEDNQERFLWVELINMSKPDLVIVDEGHYIKNTDSNRSQAVRAIKCRKIIFLTGTPVLNRPGELWPMLTMISPEQFPAHETFLNQYTYDGRTAKNVEELRTLMRPIMIRRLKKDVVKELPPINRINEYHELSEKALKLYRKIEQGLYTKMAEYDVKGQGGAEAQMITNILAQIQRLKMVCAIDKVDQSAELAQELYDSTEGPHKKVIIFSQYKACAFAIWQRLADSGEALCFVTKGKKDFYTADNDERDRLVQQFQTDPKIKYLVVTEKTTKEGHNITAAGHVIFNDLFWTPAGHDQAEGRAYGRMNDSHSINSYYMITDMDGDSIEEWIMELLAEKLAMINEVVEGVESSRDVSVVMALISKMKESMWTRNK